MHEEDGVPTTISGIESSIDSMIQAIDSKIQDSLEPRLLGVAIRSIELENGRSVLVIRIPRSWNRPHMVTFKNLSRCYARNNGGKYQMDIAEIRKQVLEGGAIAGRLAQFRRSRLELISSDHGPIPCNGRSMIVLHALPFVSLDLGASHDLPDFGAIYSHLRPLGTTGFSHRVNFDGLLTYSRPTHEVDSYLQLFRQGMVETADLYMLQRRENNTKHLYAEYIDGKVEEAIASIRGLLAALAVSPPIAWLLTLKGVKGYEIQVTGVMPFGEAMFIDRDELAVPEVIDVDMTMSIAAIAQGLLDPVWQAGGWPRSKTFERREKTGQ
jgi:hypothetical protein